MVGEKNVEAVLSTFTYSPELDVLEITNHSSISVTVNDSDDCDDTAISATSDSDSSDDDSSIFSDGSTITLIKDIYL